MKELFLFWQEFLTIVFPYNQCLVCQQPLTTGDLQQKHYICSYCQKELADSFTVCSHCPTFVLKGQTKCSRCRAYRNGQYRQAVAAHIYAGNFRQAILDFKYNHKLYLKRPLAEILCQTVQHNFADVHLDLLIPMPSHAERLKERGYDHCQLLVKYMSKTLALPWSSSALQRVKATPKLHQLNRKQRYLVLQGAFVATRAEVQNKSILLVDDIYTTGASIIHCTQALLEQGAAQVFVVTLAAGKDLYNR